jgi:putative DNA primase/helicase
MNNNNVIEQFRAAMTSAGMVTRDPIIADGTLHRVYVEGDKSGTKNGAYVLHLDGNPAGYFEYFSISLKQTWTLSGKREPLSLSMRRRIEEERKKRQSERKQRQKEVAQKARGIWHRSEQIQKTDDHPYLISKRIKPYQARLYNGFLVVPLYNEARELVNLQFIDKEGNKRFLSGGKKRECFCVIGASQQSDKILICEGYATGVSLHTKTGLFVMVAMDAGNLEPVAQAARRLFPDAEIIIAGDNDESGTGQAAARKAALAAGGKILIPDKPGADWNDMVTSGGGV